MSTIQRGELWFTESLDDSQHGSVDQADIGICILVAHLAGAPIIIALQVLHSVSASIDVIQQRNQNAWMQSLVDPVVDLDQDQRRDDEWLGCLLHKFPAASVGSIVSVQRRVQRTGIQDQRHERGCGRSSPARWAVSAWPEAPNPRLRGRGRWLASLSSSASRINSAMDVPRSAAICRRRLIRWSGVTMVVRCMASLCQTCHNHHGARAHTFSDLLQHLATCSTCVRNSKISAGSHRYWRVRRGNGDTSQALSQSPSRLAGQLPVRRWIRLPMHTSAVPGHGSAIGQLLDGCDPAKRDVHGPHPPGAAAASDMVCRAERSAAYSRIDFQPGDHVHIRRAFASSR